MRLAEQPTLRASSRTDSCRSARTRRSRGPSPVPGSNSVGMAKWRIWDVGVECITTAMDQRCCYNHPDERSRWFRLAPTVSVAPHGVNLYCTSIALRNVLTAPLHTTLDVGAGPATQKRRGAPMADLAVPSLPLAPSPGRMNVDFEERLDFARLRHYRLAPASAPTEAAGLAALLVFDNNNIRYLTGLAIGEGTRAQRVPSRV